MDAKKSYTFIPAGPALSTDGRLDPVEVEEYSKTRDKAIGQFCLLNFFCAGLPTDLRMVINLQQLGSLDLFAAVKLDNIEAQSKEEAKTKVYPVND